MNLTPSKKTYNWSVLIRILGIMTLAFVTSVSIAGATSFAYITNQQDDTVSVVDTTTDTVATTVNVGDTPFGAAVTPDGKKVYVANSDENTVSVIDTATNEVVATVKVGVSPRGIAVAPDGEQSYVTNYKNDTVSVIDTATDTVATTINVGDGPFGVEVSLDGKKVYVADANSNTVSVIDTATNKVTATVEVGDIPYSFGQFIVPASYSKDNSTAIFNSNTTSNLTDKSTETGTLIKPENGTQDLEQTNVITVTDVEQVPQKTQSTKTPGFEAIGGIVSLFAVFLRKESKKGN